jgi:chaperonin GroEL
VTGLNLEGDLKVGARIVLRALEEPIRQIAANAGHDGSIVVDKVKNQKGSFGFNAQAETYEDLIENGIIDPTKVTRLALQNAASVASLMLTTEVMIAEKPKDEKAVPPMPGGGMPGGGMY